MIPHHASKIDKLFPLSYKFINDRAFLRLDEIAYGYCEKFISEGVVVSLFLERCERGYSRSSEEGEISLLLSDEYEKVPAMLEELGPSATIQDESRSVWIYLSVAWIYANLPILSKQPSQEFYLLEGVASRFGFPPELRELSIYGTASASETPIGRDKLIEGWKSYLDRKSELYQNR